MKSRRWIVALLVLVLLAASAAWWLLGRPGPIPAGTPTPAPAEDGWINLLDAEHAAGWKNTIDDKEIFAIEDGVLHIFGDTIYPLRYAGYTAQTFANFDLHLEFKLDRGANSGLFLRAQAGDPVYRGFEVQVLEDYGRPPSKTSCGSLYDVASPMFNMSLPPGEWNSYDVSLHDSHLVVIMNGWKVLDVDLAQMTTPLGKFDVPFADLPREGIIALQDHGGECWYRNLMIRPAA